MAFPIKRCFGDGKELYAAYHDTEWGIPVYDDHRLFEMLILEGAQAGLSWETILKRRKNYQALFYNFNPLKIAAMRDEELDALCKNPGIIRNHLKIYSVRKNALIFLSIQKNHGSFSNYLWSFIDNKPLVNTWKTTQEIPTRTLISDALSKDLKKHGMSFVGSTIMYAYMQAVGMVNDHLIDCWLRP